MFSFCSHSGSGVHPKSNKVTQKDLIQRSLIPKLIVMPISQGIGAPPTCLVKPKDYVKKGTLIASASSFVSSNLHASTSGTVLKIDRTVNPSGQYSQAIFIEPDGKDEWEEGKNTSSPVYTKEEILQRIKDCGIIGMGGAGFPTHVKLNVPKDKKIENLIINGAECEPFLTADHRLMLEESENIIKGIELLRTVLGDVKVYLAIENNKPDAIAVMKNAVKKAGVSINILPLKTRYPQGDERTLIRTVTGRRLPTGKLPFDLGCVIQNVGTVFAIYEACYFNKPLIERVTTISGGAVLKGANKRVLLGTLFIDLLHECGGMYSDVIQVISGGPMMGKAEYSLEVPVIKTSSGVLFFSKSSFQNYNEHPCINCGKCGRVCPQGLSPTYLARLSSQYDFDQAVKLGLKSCIECGCCSYICPSKRELVSWIRFGKTKLAKLSKK